MKVETNISVYCTHYTSQVNEVAGSPGEMLSRRCVSLLKTALRPDVWPGTELKLAWFDKLLTTVESQQPNFNNICTALELLCFLLTILVSVACMIYVDLVVFTFGWALTITKKKAQSNTRLDNSTPPIAQAFKLQVK